MSLHTYRIGQKVWHVTGSDYCGIITGLVLYERDRTYIVSWGPEHGETEHYESELTTEKPLS